MNRIAHRLATAGALALALGCLVPRGPAAAQTPPVLQNDMIDIEYNEPRSAKCRIALSNSFGFGGQNGTLAVKRWEGAAP